MLLKRHLPTRLRAARERRRMTQQELATAAGVSRSTIGALEAGQCRRLRVETLMLLCVALELSADYLLGIDKPDTPVPIDIAMFPLVLPADAEGLRKCPACDSLLSAATPHTDGACIFTNHERGKSIAWLMGSYAVSMERIFGSLLVEQGRFRGL